MKNIFIILIISLGFIKIVNSENVTMKYGGDWVNTTVIQNGDFMSMAGSFVERMLCRWAVKKLELILHAQDYFRQLQLLC